jgi:uracil phosphoribosyltransferase
MRIQTPSGSINKFTTQKNGKTYPVVVGDRDPNNIEHWNWNYSYKPKMPNGKFVTKTVAVSRRHLATIEPMIASGSSVAEILSFLQSTPK